MDELPLNPSRRLHLPSDEQRRTVRAMAGLGIPHDDIARVVRCSPPTLRKRYRHELDTATIEANARVAQCLFQQATTPGCVAASIFWLKARAGWREKHPDPVGEDDRLTVVIQRFSDGPAEPPRPLLEGKAR